MQVFFEQRRELALGIWEYTFRPEQPVDFVPGQYVDLFLYDMPPDPRGIKRTFTLTSLPAESSIRFISKHFDLQTPYKHALQALEPGAKAWISEAMGDLVLPKSKDMPLVYIAGGIGIASFASMFADLLQRREERSIFLFYSLRTQRERLYRELTDTYPLQLQQTVLSPNHVSAQEVRDTTPPDALIYLSGSQQFVEDLRTEFEMLGTPRSSIVFDYYDGYTEL